jgi:hypothetical protein
MPAAFIVLLVAVAGRPNRRPGRILTCIKMEAGCPADTVDGPSPRDPSRTAKFVARCVGTDCSEGYARPREGVRQSGPSRFAGASQGTASTSDPSAGKTHVRFGRTQLPVRQGSGFEDSAGARGRGIGATMWRGAFGLICCVAMAFGVRLLLSSPLEEQSTFLFFTLAPCHRWRHSVWRSIARGPHRRVGSGDGHMIPSPRPSVSSRGP